MANNKLEETEAYLAKLTPPELVALGATLMEDYLAACRDRESSPSQRGMKAHFRKNLIPLAKKFLAWKAEGVL